jgi:hypothetical protein
MAAGSGCAAAGSACNAPSFQETPVSAPSGSPSTTPAALGVLDPNLGGPAIAESFLSSTALKVSSMSLRLQQFATVGSTQTLTAQLQGDSGGSPDGNAQATATALVSSVPSASPGNVAFPFASPFSLAANTTYWIVLTASYPQPSQGTCAAFPCQSSIVDWFGFQGNGTQTPGFTGGHAAYENDSNVWSTTKIGTQLGLDFAFLCSS